MFDRILKYIIWAGLAVICFIPLVVDGGYYFPYIVPKTVIFRITVEILLLCFLVLAVRKKEYRSKINLVLVLCALYLASVTISSLLGGEFYFSFWSNNERSEGLLLMFHLLAFVFILSGFLRSWKDWLVLFEISFAGSLVLAFYSLGQYLNLSFFPASTDGSRLSATIGNSGYLAGYLIFNIFFGLILFFARRGRLAKIYYILGVVLQIFITLNTLTRGAMIALVFSLFILCSYLFLFRIKKYRAILRWGYASILLVFFVLTGLVFANRDAAWVQHNRILERIVSISPEAVTARNRLMTWEAAWQGFKEKPVLGYGYENFYQVFDRYFNPKIYRHAGSVVWFDRAHNIIFDRLITGGLAGLFLYLALLFAPLYYLWKHFYRRDASVLADDEGVKKDFLLPLVFSLLLLAYFVQNLFIFEALVTYIPLFLVLAFLAQFTPDWTGGFFRSKKLYLAGLILTVVSFVPLMFSFNIKPALANKDFIGALIRAKTEQYKEAYEELIKVIDRGTSGNQEYRQHLGELLGEAVGVPVIDQDWLSKAALRTEQELDRQIAEKPLNVRNYLMTMRFLNKTYRFNPSRLDKALQLGREALALSPGRPHIFQEMAYSQVYAGQYFKAMGDQKRAEEFFDLAVASMERAIALQEQVVDSYMNMAMILLTVGRADQVQLYFDQMARLDINYRQAEQLERLGNSAIQAKEYQWTKRFYEELTTIAPQYPDYWINLALSCAYLGEKNKAVEIAEKLKDFGQEYVEQSDLFIQDVLAGKFE